MVTWMTVKGETSANPKRCRAERISLLRVNSDLALRALRLDRQEFRRDGTDDRFRHLVLYGEDIDDLAVLALRPHVLACCGVDELSGDP